jgi:hypothetical protein
VVVFFRKIQKIRAKTSSFFASRVGAECNVSWRLLMTNAIL